MTTMKKTISLALLLTCLTTATRAADYDYLAFTTTDGSRTAVTSSKLTITFADGMLTASNGSTTLATIALASLASMEFSNDGTTGIEQVTTDTLVNDETTAVYDLSGHRMPQGAALPKGVYIVKNSKRTFKMQIR